MKKRPRITPGYLVCPDCLEPLTRDDVEGFGACPYCDHAFELDDSLEDFLLGPVVQQWVRHTRSQSGDDMHAS